MGAKQLNLLMSDGEFKKKIMGTFSKLTYLTDDKISINPIIK